MSAGANWSLQNEAGWSALQEAICGRHDEIAMIIMRHYQPVAWAKWCRTLLRLVACMRRMRDFYMEIVFQFESSVMPFVGRIAPSDTYRIWKRDTNLRADTTLVEFCFRSAILTRVQCSSLERMSAYGNVVGGKLKLKGKALDVKVGGIKKKKKERTHHEQNLAMVETQKSSTNDSESDPKLTGEAEIGGTEAQQFVYEDHRTEAKNKYKEQRDQLDVRRLARLATVPLILI